jgi:hypothetical protein
VLHGDAVRARLPALDEHDIAEIDAWLARIDDLLAVRP